MYVELRTMAVERITIAGSRAFISNETIKQVLVIHQGLGQTESCSQLPIVLPKTIITSVESTK